MASQSGAVYALDPATGCTYWTLQGAVRRAHGDLGGTRRPRERADRLRDLFRGRAGARVRRRCRHGQGALGPQGRRPSAPRAPPARRRCTRAGSTSSTSGVSEETAASMPDYECCTFRGSLTSLDATTGEVVWKTYTVDEPQRRGTSTSGKPLWGPAGSPIWSAPTIDEKRGLIYAATGNAYADPAPRTSDAIVAFEIATGRIRWVNQIMPDVWILGCGAPLGARRRDHGRRQSELPRGRRARLRLLGLARARDARRTAATRSSSRRNRASATCSIPSGAAARSGSTAGAAAAPSAASGARRVDGDARIFRRGRSADAGTGRLACRRSRDGSASLVHAAAGARLRAGAGLQPGAIRGADVDSRRRVLGRRRRRHARVCERRRPSPLDVRHEPRFHDRQRRQSRRRLDRRTRARSSRAEWCT